MIVLTIFTSRSKTGKAMRACSEDKDAAQLMGINVNRTISVTFAIGSALAAIAGVLLCSSYPTLVPTTGSMPGIKAFTAAVFGGIGSIPGAFLGGILLGVIESFAKAYISTQLSNSIVFAVLIIMFALFGLPDFSANMFRRRYRRHAMSKKFQNYNKSSKFVL